MQSDQILADMLAKAALSGARVQQSANEQLVAAYTAMASWIEAGHVPQEQVGALLASNLGFAAWLERRPA